MSLSPPRTTLLPWVCALLILVTIFVVSRHIDSLKADDICRQQANCKPYTQYMREIAESQAEWEGLTYKEGEYVEVGREIRRCKEEVGRLGEKGNRGSRVGGDDERNADGSDEENRNGEIERIHAQIRECKNSIQEGLETLKGWVGQEKKRE